MLKYFDIKIKKVYVPYGPLAQSIVSSIADPRVANLIRARPHSFVMNVHVIFSMVILLLHLIQKGLLSVTSKSMFKKYWLTA